MTVSYQVENINEEKLLERNYKNEKFELKSIITGMKNSLEGFKSRFNLVEEKISKFEGMSIKIVYSEEQSKESENKQSS